MTDTHHYNVVECSIPEHMTIAEYRIARTHRARTAALERGWAVAHLLAAYNASVHRILHPITKEGRA